MLSSNGSNKQLKQKSQFHHNRQRGIELAFLDELIDEVGENEKHPLASLLDTLGTLVEAYQDKHLPEPVGDPISTLAFFKEYSITGWPQLYVDRIYFFSQQSFDLVFGFVY